MQSESFDISSVRRCLEYKGSENSGSDEEVPFGDERICVQSHVELENKTSPQMQTHCMSSHS